MPETSQSRIKVWRRCHKKYDYRYTQRLAKKAPAPPLLRGTILHEMITAGAQGKDAYEVLKKYGRKYKELWESEREVYGEDFLENIDRVYDGYERAYSSNELSYIGHDDFIATNLTSDIRFIGYLDARAQDKSGRTWLVERKSHKNIPDEKVRFADLQTVLYVWAWNRERPSTPIDGVMWDYIRTKPPTIPEQLVRGGLSQAKNIDTDYYTYFTELRRLKLDIKPYKKTLERLKSQGHEKFYQRIRLPNPSKELIDSIVEDTRQTSIEIQRLGQDLTDRNLTKDCCYDCEFYDLCQAELRGLDADFVRKSKYEIKEKAEDHANETD